MSVTSRHSTISSFRGGSGGSIGVRARCQASISAARLSERALWSYGWPGQVRRQV
jgi:hypothetical protein